MKKQLISSIASLAIIMNTIGFDLTVNAKVIEPEIVKTEIWTTSYYIDNDVNMLYPYIQCEADIYNDGTIEVYAWNTHEWDGFATISHTATFIEPVPVKYDKYNKYTQQHNFYPDVYSMSCPYTDYKGSSYPTYKGCLPQMSFCENRPEGYCNFSGNLTLKPAVEPTGTYDFKIYGHDITITPDLLQSTSMPEPSVNETELLKTENESLRAELNALKVSYDQLSSTLANQKNRAYGDMNDDGSVDGRDASLLLTYYAKTSVGYTGTLDDFIREQNNEKGLIATFFGNNNTE